MTDTIRVFLHLNWNHLQLKINWTQWNKNQSTKCLNIYNVISKGTMTKFTYMKQSLKILIFFLVWVILRWLLFPQWKCMHTLSISLFNLLNECLYCLYPQNDREKKSKWKTICIYRRNDCIWCELQLFYKLQNNALTPSVFACIIDVR